MQIYNPGMTQFNGNGITITPTKATLSCGGINDMEILSGEFSNSSRNVEYITKHSIVKFRGIKKRDQLFRIIELDKDNLGTIIIAVPLFFSEKTMVKDYTNADITMVRCVDMLGQQALNKILKNTKYTGHSDIVNLGTLYLDNSNLVESINGQQDNTFIKRWGGEITVDNYDIYINNRKGRDRGHRIVYGKNLKEIKETINMETVVTRIFPYNSQNIKLNGSKPWVDSPLINKYSEIYEESLLIEEMKLRTEGETYGDDDIVFDTIEELRKAMYTKCKNLFELTNIDKPNVTLTINMVDLSKTKEYKSNGYDLLEGVDQGDTVYCKHNKLGIETTARMVGYKYNLISEEYDEIIIGDIEDTFYEKQSDLENRVNNILDGNGNIVGDKVKGWLNAYQTGLKASKDIAKKMDYRAMELVDDEVGSPTYGSVIASSTGIYCASEKDVNGDWIYKNAITGKGILADLITAGIIRSVNGIMEIDLNQGLIGIGQTDGAEIEISKNGIRRKSAGTYFNYYYLTFHIFKDVTTDSSGNWSLTVNLGNEFKGKGWTPFIACSSSRIISNSVFYYLAGKDTITWSSNWNTATINISGKKEGWCVTGRSATEGYPLVNGDNPIFELTIEVSVSC